LPLRLTRVKWRELLDSFLLEHSSKLIAEQTRLERKRVLRALRLVRSAMKRDVPEVFSGTVEVDETYVGGQWKNKRKTTRDKGTKRGRGTTKQPVFGILCRRGIVWAEVVDEVDAATLQPLIKNRVKRGSIVCSDTRKSYTGIASKGYVHRLVNHGEGEYVRGKAHINGLEGFWGYLKRKLAAKGGVRRSRLPLYLAEYVWRYNHRNETNKNKVKQLLKLLKS
jgi:transposase-like protein